MGLESYQRSNQDWDLNQQSYHSGVIILTIRLPSLPDAITLSLLVNFLTFRLSSHHPPTKDILTVKLSRSCLPDAVPQTLCVSILTIRLSSFPDTITLPMRVNILTINPRYNYPAHAGEHPNN